MARAGPAGIAAKHFSLINDLRRKGNSMSKRAGIIALSALVLAACAPVSSPTPAPSAPEPAPAPILASTTPINVRSFTCGDLLGASDDDRSYASMFFLGYSAAIAHTRVIRISQIEAIEATALATCAASPSLPAIRAFAAGLAANRK